MNVDRVSAYNAAFGSKSLEDSLIFERDNGTPVVATESIQGAQKFIGGTGRHGKFYDLREKQIPEWEKNFKNKL